VQSPEGTKRIEILPSDTVSQLYEKVQIARDIPVFINIYYIMISVKFISDYFLLRSMKPSI